MKVTTKNLLTNFPKLSPRAAFHIMKICNGTRDPLESVEGLENAANAAYKRVNECYNRPTDVDVILHSINTLIGGYGVEGVPWEIDAMQNGEFIEYVNLGDTYITTILYNPETCKFEISDWGSLYEESPAYKDDRSVE